MGGIMTEQEYSLRMRIFEIGKKLVEYEIDGG